MITAFRYFIIIILSICITGCTSYSLKKEDLPEDMFAIIYGSDSIIKYGFVRNNYYLFTLSKVLTKTIHYEILYEYYKYKYN